MHYTLDVAYHWLQVALTALRGIEPHEVLQALSAKRRLPVPMLSPEGVRMLVMRARTNTGRPLVVVVRRIPGARMDWWIVGAREMTTVELAAFEQWEANQ
jgi:hypothetical protein